MTKAPTSTSANLGFEDKLFAAADKLRGNMDASEYKHVVLGLVFLKYISDAFMEKQEHLAQETANPKSEYYVKEESARYGVAEDRLMRLKCWDILAARVDSCFMNSDDFRSDWAS